MGLATQNFVKQSRLVSYKDKNCGSEKKYCNTIFLVLVIASEDCILVAILIKQLQHWENMQVVPRWCGEHGLIDHMVFRVQDDVFGRKIFTRPNLYWLYCSKCTRNLSEHLQGIQHDTTTQFKFTCAGPSCRSILTVVDKHFSAWASTQRHRSGVRGADFGLGMLHLLLHSARSLLSVPQSLQLQWPPVRRQCKTDKWNAWTHLAGKQCLRNAVSLCQFNVLKTRLRWVPQSPNRD